MEKIIFDQIKKSIDVKSAILNNEILINQIKNCADLAINVIKDKKKIILAGNGGSAADAQHIAGELVSRFYFDRPGVAGIALTTDTSVITAIGNDYGYENIFSRQIEAIGSSGDMFIGISTSGNSANVIKALQIAKKLNIVSVGLTGANGGIMNELCDICIKVPSTETPRIQESHILIGHIICCIIEEELFGKNK